MMKWCTKEGLIIVIMWRVSLPVYIYYAEDEWNNEGVVKEKRSSVMHLIYLASIIQLSGYD